MNHRIHVLLGPLAAVTAVLLLEFQSQIETKIIFMIGVAIWMAWWWMTEVVPVALTALLPMVLLPLLGIASAKQTGTQYMDSILFLYIGGFMLAFALEKWNLHKRLAYIILNIAGTQPSRILLGVMCTTYLVSWWISNTAAVMMLLAATLALIKELDLHIPDGKDRRKMGVALLIGLAYAASIGGIATLVGTPTNMIFYREYLDKFRDAGAMDFFEWCKVGIPVSFVMLVATFYALHFAFSKKVVIATLPADYFKMKLRELGPWSKEEIRIAIIFFATIIAWFTRSDIDFGTFKIPGWNNLFVGYENYADDGMVAVIAAFFLFLLPAGNGNARLLTWKDAEKLPFDIILLFGGGFALAFGFEASGLSQWMAGALTSLHVHPVMIVFIICVAICIISELASNVATIQLMIPLLISGFAGSNINILFLLVPATLAASLGFMMPIATPPNTIVYGLKIIQAKELARMGLIVNLVGIAAITLMSWMLFEFGYYAM